MPIMGAPLRGPFMKHTLLLLVLLGVTTSALAAGPGTGFTPQVRIGFGVDDGWEPAVATDSFGHVYVLYPQYVNYPGCNTCPSPTMALVISNDSGATWQTPKIIGDPGTGQYDAQIAVDPLDEK